MKFMRVIGVPNFICSLCRTDLQFFNIAFDAGVAKIRLVHPPSPSCPQSEQETLIDTARFELEL